MRNGARACVIENAGAPAHSKTQPLSENVWELLLTDSSLACTAEEKREQRHENCEVGSEVRGEAPVLAGVTETAAGDIEAASFCSNRGNEEDHNERSQNRQCAAIKEAKNQGEAAKNFQPGQIKCQPHSDGPRYNFVMINVVGELDRIDCFKHAGVNENCANDKIENAPDERFNHLTI